MALEALGQAVTNSNRIIESIKGEAARRTDRATRLVDSAVQAINDMATNVGDFNGEPFNPPEPKINLQDTLTIDVRASATDFGVGSLEQVPPNTFVPPTMPGITVPGLYTPSGGIGSTPQPPTINPGVAPIAPTIDTNVTVPGYTGGTYGALPTAPSVDLQMALPVWAGVPGIPAPQITGITIPSAPPLDLPAELASPPDVNASMGKASVDWTGNEYAVTILQDATTSLRGLLAGGMGIEDDGMYDRMESREDRAIRKDVAEAFVEFSSKGFVHPPGMLAARTDAIRSEGNLRKSAANREVVIKNTDVRIENMRFAVQQSSVVERLLFDVFNSMQQREFDAAKTNAELAVSAYNAVVSMYSVRVQVFKTHADVYRAKLEAVNTKLAMYKYTLDAELAKGTINEQNVRIYAEQHKALQAKVDIYRAQVDGAKAAIESKRAAIDIYRAQIDAYSATLSTERARADVYKAQVDGVRAGVDARRGIVDLYRGQVDAYAATAGAERVKADIFKAQVDGVQAQAQGRLADAQMMSASAQAMGASVAAQSKVLDGTVASMNANLQAQLAKLEASKARMANQAEVIKANVAAFNGTMQAEVAKANLESDRSRARIAVQETVAKVQVATYDVAVRKAIALLEHNARITALQLEAAKSAAQAGATLAAGYMAGLSYNMSANAGASLTGSGAVTASYNTGMSMNIEGAPDDFVPL